MGRLKLSLLASVAGGLLGLGALLWFLPVLRGALAPGGYGLTEAAPGVFVEATMPAPARDALLAEIAAAQARVAAFYGAPRAHLRILACASAACDRALGGRGAAAVTYSLGPVSVVRLAPRGLGLTILTHELAHTETHARLGLIGQVSGRMPTWFDEGLSVLISQDRRYLGPGGRCLRAPRADLPASPFDWAPAAGADRMLYAEAACAVHLWAAARGGPGAVLAALEAGAPLP